MGTWCSPVAQQAPDPTSKSCPVDTCRSGVQIPQSPLTQINKLKINLKSSFLDNFDDFWLLILHIKVLIPNI